MGLAGLKVKCTGCKKVLHVTTDKYDPDITPNGSMVELINPWRGWRWSTFDDQGQGIKTTPAVMMCCPACSAPLVIDGRLNVIEEEKKSVDIDDSLTCKVCGKQCKSLLGLNSHMRSHAKESVDMSEYL